MSTLSSARAIALALCLGTSSPALAAPVAAGTAPTSAPASLELTLERALALARARGPSVRAASARLSEAAAGRVEASIRVRENPTVVTEVGPRFDGAGDATPKVSAEVSQTFELGGARSARIEALEATVARARSLGENDERLALREVAITVERILWLDARLALSARLAAAAIDTRKVVDARAAAGHLTALEVNTARSLAARARSEEKARQADRTAEVGRLRLLLGLDPSLRIVLTGDLSDRARFDRATRSGATKERADVAAFAAEARQAEAEVRVADASSVPKLGLGVRYEHEERDANTVLGIVSVTLPLFERGQGARALSAARAARARIEQSQSKSAARGEVRTAAETYEKRVEAARALEDGGVSQVAENVALGELAFDKGEIDLGAMLTLRRELVAAESEHLDRLLEAALAGIEVETAQGGMR